MLDIFIEFFIRLVISIIVVTFTALIFETILYLFQNYSIICRGLLYGLIFYHSFWFFDENDLWGV